MGAETAAKPLCWMCGDRAVGRLAKGGKSITLCAGCRDRIGKRLERGHGYRWTDAAPKGDDRDGD